MTTLKTHWKLSKAHWLKVIVCNFFRFESSELSGHVGGAGVVVDEDEEAEDDPDGNDPYDDGSVNNPASLQIVDEDDESSLWF